jgi:hypothetical protein
MARRVAVNGDICYECRKRLRDIAFPPGPCECELLTGDAEQCWFEEHDNDTE